MIARPPEKLAGCCKPPTSVPLGDRLAPAILTSLTLSRPLRASFELFTVQTFCAPSNATEAGLLMPPRPAVRGHPATGAYETPDPERKVRVLFVPPDDTRMLLPEVTPIP